MPDRVRRQERLDTELQIAEREKNWPIFLAYLASGYNVPVSTWRRIDGLTEAFDTSGWFDPATGTFTPKRAGRFIIMARAAIDELGSGNRFTMDLYKNGAAYSGMGGPTHSSSSGFFLGLLGASFVELNGTTDNCDVRVNHSGDVGKSLQTGLQWTWVAGYFVGGM